MYLFVENCGGEVAIELCGVGEYEDNLDWYVAGS
jgi:hypothetical protein